MSRIFLFIMALVIMAATSLATAWSMIAPWNDFIAPMLGAPVTTMKHLFVAFMFMYFIKTLVGDSKVPDIDFSDWDAVLEQVGGMMTNSTAIILTALGIKVMMLIALIG